MQHVIHSSDGPHGERQIGEIAFEELHARDVIEITALARDEVVGHADAMASTDKLFREMRTDEAGAAGDKVRSHSVEVYSKS